MLKLRFLRNRAWDTLLWAFMKVVSYIKIYWVGLLQYAMFILVLIFNVSLFPCSFHMITEHHSPASYWTQQHDYSVKYAHDIYAISQLQLDTLAYMWVKYIYFFVLVLKLLHFFQINCFFCLHFFFLRVCCTCAWMPILFSTERGTDTILLTQADKLFNAVTTICIEGVRG